MGLPPSSGEEDDEDLIDNAFESKKKKKKSKKGKKDGDEEAVADEPVSTVSHQALEDGADGMSDEAWLMDGWCCLSVVCGWVCHMTVGGELLVRRAAAAGADPAHGRRHWRAARPRAHQDAPHLARQDRNQEDPLGQLPGTTTSADQTRGTHPACLLGLERAACAQPLCVAGCGGVVV